MFESIDSHRCGCVGVLMGGCSSERAVSFKSGHAVCQALREAGCQVKEIVIESEESSENRSVIAAAGIDVAFIALHGRYGEDGGIQSLLEDMGIVYVGSDAQASRKAIDKITAQQCFRATGLPVPEFWILSRENPNVPAAVSGVLTQGGVVIKPANQGSSIGVHMVHLPGELDAAIEDAFGYDDRILIERFISGRELTVGILNDRPLPIVEIKPQHPFFDFEAKYQKGLTEYIVPARLDDEETRVVQSLALRAFQALGCRDFARVDVMRDENRQAYILEMNTIPGFTGTSLLPMAAQSAGCGFTQLCVGLVGQALKRRDKRLL